MCAKPEIDPLTTPNRTTLLRLADRINASLEEHYWRWAFIFVVALLGCSIAKDVRQKMWLDELLTVHMAQQGGAAQILRATKDGSDGAPPLYAMIVSSYMSVFKSQSLAVRLPATVAYCAMVLCLLAFSRRRLPAIYSFVAALFVCDACLWYATEGRGYGIVLGCTAGALLCWQMATEDRRRGLALTLLAACLALMTAVHYYAIFFLVPLLLAEVVRWRRSHKVDCSILAAMLPALLVLVAHYPLIRAWQPVQAHRCLPATWNQIPEFYVRYLLSLWAVFLSAAIALGIFSDLGDFKNARPTGILRQEWAAIAALSLIPLLMVATSKYTTHVFVHRYALWAVIGIALLFSGVLSFAANQQTTVGLAVLGVLLVSLAIQEIRALWTIPVLQRGEAVLRELETLPNTQEPIVVANAPAFVELSYYAEPRLRQRLVYALSRDLELRYTHCDTFALLMLGLSRHTNLHIVDYNAVVAEDASFLLAAAADDYLPKHLIAAGYQLTPLNPGNPPVLYAVQAPEVQRKVGDGTNH